MEEKYQNFARKYRPQSFAEVIGQEAVVTTLKNAIKYKKASHAYLFSGLRGVGKTTMARLFAKALNCQNPTDEIEPCNKCSSCLEITSSCSLDVIEIDGASNRGIDDIRQINESIGYSPTSGKYKIYIIDEVHMLTKEAFNALLKTLEEPPSTIKFFFATTEPHKIPPTILSRCQRFDLQRISNTRIIKKLSSIAKDITREVEKEALQLIAHYSEGSLRDAESLFDQITCYETEAITEAVIYKILGFLPKDVFFDLDNAMSEGILSFAFDFVDMIFKSGKDLSYFMEELIEHYRYLILIKIQENNEKLNHLSESVIEKYVQSAKLYTEEQCLYILDFIIQSQQNFQRSSCKKITLEMILIKIIRSKTRIPIASLVKRLCELEKIQKEKPFIPEEIQTPKPKQPVELEEIPFSLEQPKENHEKSLHNDEKTMPQSHYDTLMRFTSVELNGIIKNEDN